MEDYCIDNGDGEPCGGEVYDRLSRSGITSSVRCDHHYARQQERLDAIERRYPVHAPSWFDPSYAGESWDEDY